MFSILYVSDWHIIKYFAIKLLIFYWVVLLAGKLSWMEPLSPAVRTLDKLDTGLQRHRVDWHPDADQLVSVHGVVSLVMVPGGLLLSPGLLVEDMLMIEHGKL